MKDIQRKITYKLYPKAKQEEALQETLALHCRVHNTLLEEHIRLYEEEQRSYSFKIMCLDITQWRARSDALAALNAQSLQVTAKRVALGFANFFRRVKDGEEEPGFPRFKSVNRYSGWGYKTYGDGWKLFQPGGKHGKVRLSGIGQIPMRGKGRVSGTPKTAEVMHKAGKWYLSVTYNVTEDAVARPCGTEEAAFDWGVDTLVTLVTGTGNVEVVENPRWLKSRLEEARTLQSEISKGERGAKIKAGYDPNEKLPKGARLKLSNELKKMKRAFSALTSKVARQRKDFYHKLTAKLVSRFGRIGTEELAVRNMTKKPEAKENPDKPGEYLPNGKAAKAGLNRSILDAAPSMFLNMLRIKAEEAGSWLSMADTKKLKPTQRCHVCGALVKKKLSERTHRCSCGCVCGRDENAARTILRWMIEGFWWLGTDHAVLTHSLDQMPIPLAMVIETPPIPA